MEVEQVYLLFGFVVFQHTGSYATLHKFYQLIYEEWFPKNKYRPKSTFSFEIYLNNPRTTKFSELITEIYIITTDIPFVEYTNFETLTEQKVKMVIGFKFSERLWGKEDIKSILISVRKII